MEMPITANPWLPYFCWSCTNPGISIRQGPHHFSFIVGQVDLLAGESRQGELRRRREVCAGLRSLRRGRSNPVAVHKEQPHGHNNRQDEAKKYFAFLHKVLPSLKIFLSCPRAPYAASI